MINVLNSTFSPTPYFNSISIRSMQLHKVSTKSSSRGNAVAAFVFLGTANATFCYLPLFIQPNGECIPFFTLEPVKHVTTVRPTEHTLKHGTHYPCPRAVHGPTAREHRCPWRSCSRAVDTGVKQGRPASADRTARHQFQATGQPVSRTQASDAMTSRLPRYEAKCVQRRCFRCGSVHLRSDIKGTYSKGNWLRYNFAGESFYIMLIFALNKLNIRHISTSGLVDLLT